VNLHLTHIGTATVLLEFGGWRILTDPAFDPPGGKYGFGFGTSSKKLLPPAIAAADLGRIDLVLLSHDHHADNLDTAGRQVLTKAATVVTTQSGARRLGGTTRGLAPWQSIELKDGSGAVLKITATPARHGPPLSGPIVGDVIGFVLEWEGQQHGALYISGDTVLFAGVEEVGRRFKVGTALLHLGGVAFPISGPLRYTFNGAEAAQVITQFNVRTAVPIHYDGWTHFREKREASEHSLHAVKDRVVWVRQGDRVALAV